MGVGVRDLALLVRLKREGFIQAQGAVMEIGAQQLANDALRHDEILAELQVAFGRSDLPGWPKPSGGKIIHGEREHLDEAAPRTRELWQWLGFEYAAIDIDGSPGSIALDLNYDPVPKELKARFNVVTNYGTTEHVANQLHAFKVIHDLTAQGGVMIHHMPTQGYLNHGLVNYNPKFFWMLARSNGYKWLYSDFRMSNAQYGLPENIQSMVAQSEPDIEGRAEGYRTADCETIVAVQKSFDIEYVPPIDVPTGTDAPNGELRKRYWTVFDSDAFGN